MNARNTRLLTLATAGLLPFLIGLRVHVQGFNLMDDGLWLLSARTVADGGHLYRDLFQIYGPARSFLLVPFFWFFGQSVGTLALFKAVLDGVAGAVGFHLTRRLGAGRWAWLVPFGVIALGPVYPRYVAAGLFAGLVAGVLCASVLKRRGWLVGASWGGLSLFGLDMFAYGLVCVLGSLLFHCVVQKQRQLKWPAWTVLSGLLLVLLPGALVALIAGYGDTMWWDTVIYPLTRFGDEMGRSWWTVFRSDEIISQSFAGLFSGENLPPLWVGHGVWLSLAWRSLYVLAWLAPLIALGVIWRRSWVDLLPFALVSLASWLTLSGRGDLAHLRLVAWLLLLLAPPLLARLISQRGWQLGALLICCLVLGPRFGERLWLASHLERPTLVKWERESIGIHLAEDRRRDLEQIWQKSGWDGRSPVVAWPAQPGLVFAMGAPLATPQMTLLAGEVRNAGELVRRLSDDPPSLVILGRSAGLVQAVRGMRILAPEVYSFLRRDYALAASVKGAEAVFRILRPAAGDVQQLPLEQRLPGDSQYLRTGTTPIMGPGTSVAQTVLVSDFEVSGLAILVGSPGPWPQLIQLQLKIVSVQHGAGDQLLATIPFEVVLHQQVERVELAFDAVPQTEGQMVIMEITGNENSAGPFTLFWHVPGPDVADHIDYYPAGRAFWNQRPVAGDLFFAVY